MALTFWPLQLRMETSKPSNESRASGHIAIVGMGIRFPGNVSTREGLAEFLRTHGDGVVDVPADRWNSDRFYSADKEAPGRLYVRRAAFLKQDIFSMDPGPFHLSPRECEQLDPQQRLLLEAAWDAFEDAGIPVTRLSGTNTGVYVGGFMLDARDLASFPESRRLVEGHFATGVGQTVLSNRISYTFDLLGPSLTVDTACSSSLVTVHLACRDLADEACDLAVAGGVNVMLSPLSTLMMCKGQFLSPDGRSKTFDASADGYGRGEGAGLVLLKRLEDAVRDGDRIYATILATGVNQDGRTEGMPFPNGRAQVALSRRVTRQAGIDPKRVGYVEAHGTGTKAGDTTEVQALSEVYAGPARAVPLLLGSIKTNIGHLEAAAGVAGLIKAALSLHYRTIFPLRKLEKPNPAIDFEGGRLRVPLKAEPWPEGTDLTAAVNSFGYGGTNAHVVLSAAPAPSVAPSSEPSAQNFLPVSACDEAALRARCAQLASFADSSLSALASTLAHHRAHLPHRALVLVESAEQAREALLAIAAGETREDVLRDRADVGKLCCVYTGMGPQWWGMGRGLFESEPAFRDAAFRVDALFERFSGWSLLAEMFGPQSESESKMASNRVAQPANFLLQVALTEALWSKGVRFAGYLGHSVGELTAAWATGCLSLEQATLAAFHRSDLQQRVAGRGTMLAVELGLQEAEQYCRRLGDLSVAAINGPKSVVLSGSRDALDRAAQALDAKGVFARFMRVEVAYHSHHMDPLQDGFLDRLAPLSPRAPEAPLFSTALGAEVHEAVHDAEYWWKNARMPVLLQPALAAAFARGFDAFLEVGPHPVLSGALQANARSAAVPVKAFSVLARNQPQERAFVRCLGTLHCAGVALDWEKLVPRGSRLELPAYPFQRRRLWGEGSAELAFRLGRPGAHPLLDQRRDGGVVRWTTELDDTRFGWLEGHRVLGARVFPGAGYLELGFAASAETFAPGNTPVLEDVRFESALVLPERNFATLVVELSGQSLTIHAETEGGLARHATMRLGERARYATPPPLNLAEAIDGLSEEPIEEVYRSLLQVGLAYGGAFKCLERLWRDEDRVVCQVSGQAQPGYWVFPACLDAVFQSLLVLGKLDQAIVPVRARSVRCLERASSTLYASACRSPGGGEFAFDVQVWDEHGRPVLTIECLECAPVERSRQLRSSELEWLHGKSWIPAPTNVALRAIRPLYLCGNSEAEVQEVAAALQRAGQPTRIGAPPARSSHVVFVATASPEDPIGQRIVLELLEIVRALPEGAELTVLTRGAYSVEGESPNPAVTAVVGLVRVVMTERPELGARIVDLPSAGTLDGALLRDSVLGRDEEECAIRGETRHALRIVRVPARDEARRARRRPAEPGESAELFLERPGTIDGLAYRPRLLDAELAPDEVEIDVEYASLNFKDLMKVTGLIGDVALERTALGKTIGIEAAGRAVRVGSRVQHVQAGQLVVGFRGGLATRARSPGHLTVAASRTHGGAEASCLLVFMTAWHALVELARLGRGERVLIHAATGGVGLAAIQIAKYLGAEIYATAGRPHKRELLRELGVQYVYDSRTLDYAHLVRRDTAGQGVNVVLNSLPGDHLRRSIDLLAAGGRFVEIGKQDFAENTELGLAPFGRALSFFAVDLDRMSLETPEFFRPLAEAVCRAFDDGILQPLPMEVYPATAIGDAFRRLADADRIGKVVVDLRGGVGEVAPNQTERPLFERRASYLVVGGLDGFGLRTAEWLADNGAGTLVLASRRGRPTPAVARRLERITEATGCAVRCEAFDVTDFSAVRRLVSSLAESERPLKGVFHAAAVLDDVPLHEIDAASLARVLGPKALGACHLDLATRELSLDHFVLFGSVSALVGNPGQGSYSAANAFLDGLAGARRARGLPGTCISWGAIDEVGMVARDDATRAHLQSIGFSAINPDRALEALKLALEEQRTEHAIVAADWSKWQRHAPSTPWKRLAGLSEKRAGGAASRGSAVAASLASLSDAQKLEEVRKLLIDAIAPTFKVRPEEFDADKPLRDMGLDSLVAVELQAQIESRLGVELSSMELLAGRPASALAGTILQRLQTRAADAAEPEAPTRSASLLPGNLRTFFLERICVQPPYFALETISHEGEWLTARVTPAPLPPAGSHSLAVAEMARHAAILGSCAARLEYAESDGRVFYPVRHATLLTYTGEAWPEEAILRARCTSFDARLSSAVALTEFHTADGKLVGRFEVTYHVIAEADFERLFAAHARSTNEASGADPYREFAPVDVEHAAPGYARAQLGKIDAERCLGHFVGFPAYPVSIMVRDGFSALHSAICAEHGEGAVWAVEGGSCQTQRFVFADEAVEIRALRKRTEGRSEEWVCEIVAGNEVTASLDVVLRVAISDMPGLDERPVSEASDGERSISQSAE